MQLHFQHRWWKLKLSFSLHYSPWSNMVDGWLSPFVASTLVIHHWLCGPPYCILVLHRPILLKQTVNFYLFKKKKLSTFYCHGRPSKNYSLQDTRHCFPASKRVSYKKKILCCVKNLTNIVPSSFKKTLVPSRKIIFILVASNFIFLSVLINVIISHINPNLI